MKTFGWNRPVRSPAGEIIGSKPSPVKARTTETLGHSFGSDHNKRLVVTAHQGDLIGFRPERTRREVFIKAMDVYTYVLRAQANLARLEKARAKRRR